MSNPQQVPKKSKLEFGVSNGDLMDDPKAPSTAVNALPVRKEPPPETNDALRLRYLVLLSFWAIIILLGLPVWWKTTAIYRASLPLDQMMDWADGRVSLPRKACARAHNITGVSSRIPTSDINRSKFPSGP